MSAVGPLHGRDNALVAKVISLFATLNNIPIIEFTNSSFRLGTEMECQPDSSFYLSRTSAFVPQTNTPIDVQRFGAPSLVIEIASTTLNDDLGQKRLLYERLGVAEYWVVDAVDKQVFAFEISDGRSGQISISKVLPGLELDWVKEVLKRGQSEDDGVITRWILQLFSEQA